MIEYRCNELGILCCGVQYDVMKVEFMHSIIGRIIILRS